VWDAAGEIDDFEQCMRVVYAILAAIIVLLVVASGVAALAVVAVARGFGIDLGIDLLDAFCGGALFMSAVILIWVIAALSKGR